jgi:hypothetical protein
MLHAGLGRMERQPQEVKTSFLLQGERAAGIVDEPTACVVKMGLQACRC